MNLQNPAVLDFLTKGFLSEVPLSRILGILYMILKQIDKGC